MSRRVVVLHEYFGCETGCCGHVVEIHEDGKPTETSRMEFAHPYDGDPRAFAEALVLAKFGADHVADLDWENCEVIDD